VSAGWPLTPLGDVLVPASRPVPVDRAARYRLLGVRLDGAGPFLREERTGGELSANSIFEVKENDFIYSRLFAWRGAFGVIPPELDGCFVSNEFPTFRPKNGAIDPQFLKYWFRLQDVLHHVESDCSGSTPLTRNRYKEKFFLRLEIPLPRLAEQRRVVAKIDGLAAKIDEARGLHYRSSAETALSAQNISESLFATLEAQFGIKAFASFDPHVSSGPRNWSQYYEDEGLRFYRAQDVGADGAIIDTNPQFIRPPPNDQGRSARLECNDIILVITGATIGRVAVFGPEQAPGLVNQHVAVCRFPLDSVCVRYVLWGLRSPIGQVQLLGDKYGQGKPGLNLKNIRSIKLPFPPISEQRATVAYLDGLQAKVDRLKALQAQTRAELDALLPSILDRAFKGEL
jgi:type I restriction enzyme, S subunit